MSEKDAPEHNGEYVAPWERAFDWVLTPLEEFIHRQSSSSILLVFATLLALVCANTGLADYYQHFIHTSVGAVFGTFSIEKSLHHWVNDGLMAVFFFVVGLELKREFLIGELANPRAAALPIIAAIGGMVVPAFLYLFLNGDGDAARGWGIPMATDIAFAMGALALLGRRIPRSLVTFLLALAIIDDLGAVLVIAVFYTDQISLSSLGVAAVFFSVMIAFKYGGIRGPWPYLIMAVLLWFALLKSGVHATLAGILGALTVPVRPKYDARRFSVLVRDLMTRFESSTRNTADLLRNVEARAILQTLENGVHRVQAPLQRLEHAWHFPVAYLILPVFAFVNAGISIQPEALSAAFSQGETRGVVIGLVAGKVLGVAGLSFFVVRMGWMRWPPGVTLMHVIGVGFLSGIGFTMSIFVSELAFADTPQMLVNAKTGVLAASILSGALGLAVLRLSTRPVE